jgi:hypothetical protein
MTSFVRLVLTSCALMLAMPAHAYIDPNAGGALFQLLAPLFAGLVGAWLVARRWIAEQLRKFWRRITGQRDL